jgi:hypothetical protein
MRGARYLHPGTDVRYGDAAAGVDTAAVPERLSTRASFFVIAVLNLTLCSGLWALVKL